MFSVFIYIPSKVDLFENTKDEFVLESSFFDIGALSIGGDVKIRGVKVGEVSKISLDQNTYLASVITSSITMKFKYLKTLFLK